MLGAGFFVGGMRVDGTPKAMVHHDDERADDEALDDDGQHAAPLRHPTRRAHS